MGTLTLTSPAFADQETIPAQYTCDGENISPPLNIAHVPEGTKSLALIVEDPDAPSGVWVHWTVWNINPHQTEIAENTVPKEAVIGRNDFHKNSYGGPCPPSGIHRYIFTLYALDSDLDLAGGASRQELGKVMQSHIRAETSLTGLYGKV